MAQEKESEDRIDVTGKTPAGFTHLFEIRTASTIDQVITAMVAHFVGTGQLQPGEYNLVLVDGDGKTTALVGSHRIADYEIEDEDELDLVVAEPQRDG